MSCIVITTGNRSIFKTSAVIPLEKQSIVDHSRTGYDMNRYHTSDDLSTQRTQNMAHRRK